MRAERDATGRDPAAFRVAKRVPAHGDEDAARARTAVAGTPRAPHGRTDTAVRGSPGVCAAGLRDVAAAGADLIPSHPVADEAAQRERLAAEVISLAEDAHP